MGCFQSKDEFNGIDKNGQKFLKVYEIGPQIGKGAFGSVVEAYKKHPKDGDEDSYAVKIILSETGQGDPLEKKHEKIEHAKLILRDHEEAMANGEQGMMKEELDLIRKFIADMETECSSMTPQLPLDEIENEIKILEECHHENIIQCYGVYRDEKKGFAVVMKRCFKSVQQAKPLFKCNQAKGFMYFAGLMEGLKYLHDLNIIHRDIKPDNMMVDQHDNAMIVDFGLAHKFNGPDELSTDTSNLAGTVTYMPPEAWYSGQSRAGDVWAAGCCLFWLLFDAMVIKKELCPDNMTTVRNGSIMIDDDANDLAKPKDIAQDRNKTMRFVEFIQQEANAQKILVECTRIMNKWFEDCEKDPKMPKRHADVRTIINDCLNLDWQNRKSAAQIIESQAYQNVIEECRKMPRTSNLG